MEEEVRIKRKINRIRKQEGENEVENDTKKYI